MTLCISRGRGKLVEKGFSNLSEKLRNYFFDATMKLLSFLSGLFSIFLISMYPGHDPPEQQSAGKDPVGTSNSGV